MQPVVGLGVMAEGVRWDEEEAQACPAVRSGLPLHSQGQAFEKRVQLHGLLQV